MDIIDITSDKALEERDYVIYGAGNVGKMVHKWLKRKKKHVVSFCDSNPANWKKKIIGVDVQSPEVCAQKYSNSTFIVANEKHYQEIIEKLEMMGFKKVILCNSFYVIKELYILSGKYAIENKHYIFDRPLRDDKVFHINAYIFKFCGNIKKLKMKKDNSVNKKKYEVSLCLIFYNEAKYLKEWIEYHRIVGVDHFYLYDNLSTDNSMEVLQPYIDMGIVEVAQWKDRPGQMTAYIDCAKKHKDDSEWIGFIDTDEFIVPVDDNNIKKFLKKFKNRGSVLINWKCFGYNGKISRNSENLVTEDFTQTTYKYNQLGKCFWNTRFAYRDDPENMMQIHYLYTVDKHGKLNPLVNCFDLVCNEEYQFALRDRFPIQINHYMHKSYDEYCERKKHGRATTARESYRNIHQFYRDESVLDCFDKKIFKYLGKLKSTIY